MRDPYLGIAIIALVIAILAIIAIAIGREQLSLDYVYCPKRQYRLDFGIFP